MPARTTSGASFGTAPGLRVTGMAIEFPNASRSFEGAKKRVRFWGYDDAIEITFFVDAEALARLQPDVDGSETGYLSAFDASRERIQSIAARCYERGKTRAYAYILSAAEF